MTHLSNMQILRKSMWVALASEAADGTGSPAALPPNLRSQERVSSKQAGYSTPVWTNYRSTLTLQGHPPLCSLPLKIF